MTYYSLNPHRFGSVSMVTATLGNNDPELGTRCTEGGSTYAFCYNAGAAAIKVGWGGYLNSSNSGLSVSVSNAASQVGPLVGVCHHESIPAGSYGWLVVKGVSYVAADATETSQGVSGGSAYIVPGVDGGFVVAPATISTGARLGLLISTMQTQGTTAQGKAYIFGSVFV